MRHRQRVNRHIVARGAPPPCAPPPAALQSAQLDAVVLATVDWQHVKPLQVRRVALECLRNLDRKLAGGGQSSGVGCMSLSSS